MTSAIDVPSLVEPFKDKLVAPDCQFNRSAMFNSDSVTAYRTSTVAVGSQCESEIRVCRNGNLTGSFQFSACLPGVPASCLQNGSTIPHNRSLKFYRTSSVPYGSSCEAEERSCNNGILAGTFGFSECRSQHPTDCVVGEQRFAHNTQKLFFKSKTVLFGQSCQSEFRQCHNGVVINGTFAETGCGIETPASCTHGNETILHNRSKTFYRLATVPFGQTCQSKSLDCYNGLVTGDTTFAAAACTVQGAEDCKLFDGTPVPHRGTIIAYEFKKVAFRDVCERYSKVLQCDNKVIPESAKYKYSDCSVGDAAQCVLPDGTTINDNSSMMLKKQKYIASGETCDAPWNIESVGCQNGQLTGGTARFQTCQIIPPILKSTAGGEGGVPFEQICSTSGARAVGLFGASGSKLDRIGVKCSMTPDTGTSGGGGGGGFSAVCPPGKLLTGISGTTEGSYTFNFGVLTSIQLFCANSDGSGGALGPSYGVASGFRFYQICPPGSVMHGLKGRAGGLVDQVQAVCVKMNDGANINCVGEWINQGCRNFRGRSRDSDGEGDGEGHQRFYHKQPAGGSGTVCQYPDGDVRETADACK